MARASSKSTSGKQASLAKLAGSLDTKKRPLPADAQPAAVAALTREVKGRQGAREREGASALAAEVKGRAALAEAATGGGAASRKASRESAASGRASESRKEETSAGSSASRVAPASGRVSESRKEETNAGASASRGAAPASGRASGPSASRAASSLSVSVASALDSRQAPAPRKESFATNDRASGASGSASASREVPVRAAGSPSSSLALVGPAVGSASSAARLPGASVASGTRPRSSSPRGQASSAGAPRGSSAPAVTSVSRQGALASLQRTPAAPVKTPTTSVKAPTADSRRRYPRANLQVKARLSLADDPSRVFEAALPTVNISVGGLFLESSFFLKMGTRLLVELKLPPKGRTVQVKAEVVRVESTVDGASGFALRFTEYLDGSEVVLATHFLSPVLKEFITAYAKQHRFDASAEYIAHTADVLAAWELKKAELGGDVWSLTSLS